MSKQAKQMKKTVFAQEHQRLMEQSGRLFEQAGRDPLRELALVGEPVFHFNAGHIAGVTQGQQYLAEAVLPIFREVSAALAEAEHEWSKAQRKAWDKAYSELLRAEQGKVQQIKVKIV
jgi:hypothetical protein